MKVCMMAAVVGAAAAVVSADTAVLQASADNTLYEDTLGVVSNGSGAYFFAGDTGQFGARRGLVRFDVAAAVPAGSTVTSAVLTLHLSRTRAAEVNVSVHRVLSSWGEGTSDAGEPGGSGTDATAGDATWLYRSFPGVSWGTAGGDFVATPSATRAVNAEGFYSWDASAALDADVQGWLDAPSSNHGWMVVGPELGERSAKRFDSRENTEFAFRPVLTIEFTPPPPTCAADANGDNQTDGADLSVLLGQFGTSVPPGTGADFNGDGLVNAADLSVLLGDFGCE